MEGDLQECRAVTDETKRGVSPSGRFSPYLVIGVHEEEISNDVSSPSKSRTKSLIEWSSSSSSSTNLNVGKGGCDTSSPTSCPKSPPHRQSLPAVLSSHKMGEKPFFQPVQFGVCRIQPISLRPLIQATSVDPHSTSSFGKAISVEDRAAKHETSSDNIGQQLSDSSPDKKLVSEQETPELISVDASGSASGLTSDVTPRTVQLLSTNPRHVVNGDLMPSECSLPNHPPGSSEVDPPGGVLQKCDTILAQKVDLKLSGLIEKAAVPAIHNGVSTTVIVDGDESVENNPDSLSSRELRSEIKISEIDPQDWPQTSVEGNVILPFTEIAEQSFSTATIVPLEEETDEGNRCTSTTSRSKNDEGHPPPDDVVSQENTLELGCISDDIPFIDDDDEDVNDDYNMQSTVVLRQRPSQSVPRVKRHAEVMLPTLRTSVVKKIATARSRETSGQEEGPHQSKDHVISREEDMEEEDEDGSIVKYAKQDSERQLWFCVDPTGLDCISETTEEAGGEGYSKGPRPLSLNEDALQMLLHKLLTEKTAAEAADIMSVERRGTKALELWARRATDGYVGVSISNMTTAWRNGLAFCALIHHYRPDLIDFPSLKPENILENNALAFRVAEQQLGIPALLDAEDMVECDIPDRLSVLTYVSQFYQVFSSLGLTSPKRVVNNISPPPSSPAGVKKTKLTPPQPQPKTKTEIKTDKVLVGGRLRREVCVRCSNPVFLAERLLVGSPGQLMHRTCFRCARCTTQLTLASYYETEKGQFCCETCPDEENIAPEDTNSVISGTSPKLSRRTSTSDSESEYDSEGSENESDGYSNTVELVLEDKTQKDDTPTHSPKVTPGPPKPRTVFLSKTLEDESPASSLNEHKETPIVVEKETLKFSQVSPALFGSKEKDARATKASDSGLDHCDDAKGLITDPPDKLTLDTGQGKSRDHVSDSAVGSSSSIVARRLKMFREISNKTNSTSNLKTNIFNKTDHKENDLSLQHKEKDSSLQFKVSETPFTSNKLTIKDEGKDELKGTISDPDKDENTASLIVEKVLKKDETDSKPDEKIPCEENEVKSTKKDLESVPVIPSITISNEKQEDNDSQKETEGTEVPVLPLNEAITTPVAIKEVECVKGSGSESSPFDVEDESQLEESGVAVIQSQREGGGSDIDNNATSLSQDSGAELSAAAIHYPEDLNPFGSDNEDEMEGAASISENVVIAKAEAKKDEVPAKKLIKVNLNPFESDEDEDESAEKETKNDEKNESKNLNPFWSDDEEPSESANSTPSKSKTKPPRPPPPTLARNSTPSYMYQKKEASPSPQGNWTEGKKSITTPPPVRELFPQPKASPASSQSRLSPSLPPAKAHPSPSSPSGSVTLRRKGRRAPAPPPTFTPKSDGASSSESTADTMSVDTMSLSSLGTQGQAARGQEDEGQDEVLSRKLQKDMKNHSNKMNGTTEQRAPPPKPARIPHTKIPHTPTNVGISKGMVRKPSMSKSEAGEWQRKKGPAPLRPVPQKRAIRKMPMRLVQQELHDIEVKQTELERQGVLLETAIRNRTETTSNNPQEDAATISSGPSSIEVEDMIMQLFELVNEKNELFRRQTELMYLKREKRLEEEYVELEFQIRCLMLKTPSEKSEIDTAQEEELIARLVKVVEQRDEIINCLELDRLREAQEDESIATHMMQYQEKHIDGIENGCVPQNTAKKKKTLKLPRKKKKKEKKDKKGGKADADKDIDETEVKETKKKKKKWLF